MFDVAQIIHAGGLLLVAFIVYIEVALMVGFFLPGDTLLLTAGIFAGQGKLPLVWTIVVIAICAIAGDNTAYHIGQRLGPRLFKKKDGLIFRQEYVRKAEQFYNKYGSKTAMFAHFVPIVRSFAPLLAGVGKMPYARFVTFNAIGDIIWAVGITLLGYFVGTQIPDIDRYIQLVLVVVIVVSFGPSAYHLFKAYRTRRNKSEV
jgi:membrane-associated protein